MKPIKNNITNNNKEKGETNMNKTIKKHIGVYLWYQNTIEFEIPKDMASIYTPATLNTMFRALKLYADLYIESMEWEPCFEDHEIKLQMNMRKCKSSRKKHSYAIDFLLMVSDPPYFTVSIEKIIDGFFDGFLETFEANLSFILADTVNRETLQAALSAIRA